MLTFHHLYMYVCLNLKTGDIPIVSKHNRAMPKSTIHNRFLPQPEGKTNDLHNNMYIFCGNKQQA